MDTTPPLTPAIKCSNLTVLRTLKKLATVFELGWLLRLLILVAAASAPGVSDPPEADLEIWLAVLVDDRHRSKTKDGKAEEEVVGEQQITDHVQSGT